MDILAQFKNYLLSQKNQPSKVTVKNYLSDINHFIKFFEDQYKKAFSPSEISFETIRNYKTQSASVLSESSLDRHMSSLRKFFYFLKLEGYISSDPFKAVLPQPVEVKDPWHIKEFKNYLYVFNASNLTIKNYIIDIRQFLTWAETVTPNSDLPTVGKINKELIEEYKQRLITHNNFSATTVNRKLSSLRKYLSWAQEEGFIKAQPEITNYQTPFFTTQPEAISQELSKTEEPRIKNYSWFPPLRVAQKMGLGFQAIFDKAITETLAKGVRNAEYIAWKVKGKHVFTEKSSEIKAKIPDHNFLKVSNIKKEFYAPLTISTANLPSYKKYWIALRYKRPNWYKTYHSYPLAHYLNFAVLIIIMAAIGFGFYTSFFDNPKNQSPILAAAPVAPPRILSFQGRLTDSNDNPITSPTWLRFGIYTSATASDSGTTIFKWQETDYVSPDTDGIFNVLLGQNSVIPPEVFTQNNALWLGVTVGQTAELTPRQPLATVAYATNAETLQGMYPTTATTSATNVILALDSSGNLSIGGTATPTFQATGGQFKLLGQPLVLGTNVGSNANVTISPDGLGKIDLQKPLQNSSYNNNISTAQGAVEVDDMFAVLATSSGQSAVTINQGSTGPIISASASGVAKFTVDASGNVTAGGILSANSTSNSVFGDGTTGGIKIGDGTITKTTGSYFSMSSGLTLAQNLTISGNNITNTTLYLGNGSAATLGTVSNDDLSIIPNGTGALNLATTNTGNVSVGNSTGTITLNSNTTVTSGKTLTLGGITGNNAVLYATTGTGVVTSATTSTSGQCLVSGAGAGYAPSWGSCSTGNYNFWQELTGALSPINSSDDLLIGGSSTSSAEFAFTGLGLANHQTQASFSGQLIVMPNNGYGGNVGIGTTSPGAKLDISDTSGNAFIKLTPSGVDSASNISYLSANSRAYFGYDGTNLNTVVQGVTGKGIEFNVNNNSFGTGTAMVINSSGNVGIGTTNPGQLLTLSSGGSLGWDNGSGSVTTGISRGGDGYINIGNGTPGNTSGTVQATTINLTNVVNTTSHQSFRLDQTGKIVQFNNSAANASAFLISPGINDYSGASATVQLSSSGNSYLTGGNLGIGTNNPQTALQVVGNSAQINNTVWGWSQTGVNPASDTYYKIATLPISTSATYDHIVINGILDDGWGSNQKSQFNILMGNRNGFKYEYDLFGDVRSKAKILAYQETDGSISVYTYHKATSYTSISYNITESIQATVYPNPTGSTSIPTGTLVFDSSSASYPPRYMVATNGNFTIGGTTATSLFNVGSSAQFQVNSSGAIAASTGLTLTSGAITLGASTGAGQCLIGGANASWGSCSTGNYNYWQELSGALSPIQSGDDLLLGGSSTASAEFAFTGLGLANHQTQASFSGQLIVMPNNGYGGNVGIGTNTPAYTLDVTGTGHTTGAFTIDAGAGSANAQLNLTGRNSGTANNAYILANYQGGVSLNAATSRGFVLSNTGATYSNTGAVLEVSGSQAIGSTYVTTTPPSNGLIVEGNVGIGTAAPQVNLDVFGTQYIRDNGTLASVLSGLKFVPSGGINYIESAGAAMGAGTGADLRFTNMNATSTWMTIQASSGNVGIGTTNPGQLLTVGPNSSNGQFTVNTTGAVASVGTTGQVFFTGHQVGSGYSYGAPGIFQAITDNLTGANNTYFQGVTGSTTNFSVRADGQGYFAGNVGIGTNNPVAQLDVRNGAVFKNSVSASTPVTPFASSSAEFLLSANSLVTIGESVQGNANPAITLYRTTSGNRIGTGARLYLASSNFDFRIQQGTNGTAYGAETYTDRLTINSSGYVGIGNSNSAALFSVGSSSNFQVDATGAITTTGNGLSFTASSGDTVIKKTGASGILDISSNGGTSAVRFNYDYGGGTGGIQIYDGATTNNVQLLATSGNLAIAPSGGTGSNVAPTTNQQIDLGDATHQWRNIYGQNIYSNGVLLTNGGTGFWQELVGALSPVQPGDDLLIGGSATASADFAFTGLGLANHQTQASFSGQLIIMPNNGYGGNVGIGTTTPGYPLDVAGNARLIGTGSTYLTIQESNSGSYETGINFVNNGSGTNYTGSITSSWWNNGMTFTSPRDLLQNGFHFKANSGTEAMHIDVANSGITIGSSYANTTTAAPSNGLIVQGNVGIGTTSPTYAKLQVNAPSLGTNTLLSLSTNDGTYNPRAIISHVTSTTSQYVNFDSTYSTGTGYANWIFSDGNMGIGTTAPYSSALLHVRKDQNATTNLYVTNKVALGNTAAGSTINVEAYNASGYFGAFPSDFAGVTAFQQRLVFATNSDATGLTMAAGNTGQYINFFTGNTNNERMRIDSSGNVGIGTTTPLATLDARGNSASTPVASFSGTTTGPALGIDSNTGGGDLINASSGLSPALGRLQFKVTNLGSVYGRSFTDMDNNSYFLDPAASGTSLTTAGAAGIGTYSITGTTTKLDVAGGIGLFEQGIMSGWTTTTGGGTYTNQYFPIASVSIPAQYGYGTADILISKQGAAGSQSDDNALVHLQVKQQAAFGSPPIVSLQASYLYGIKAANIVFVLTSYAGPTTGTLYVKNPTSYEEYTYTALSASNNITIAPTVSSPVASLPAGTQTNPTYAFYSYGGNMGIGTDSPASPLHIYGNSSSGITGEIQNTNSAGYAYLLLKSDAAQNMGVFAGGTALASYGGANSLNIFQGNNAPISFLTGGTNQRMVITGTGDVGIGITAPNDLLDVSESSTINVTTPGLATTYGIHLTAPTNVADYANGITFGAGQSSSGNTAQAGIYVQSSGAYGTKMYFATTNSFATGAQTRMMIDHLGNVGIGTTSPTAMGSGGTTTILQVHNAGTGANSFGALSLSSGSTAAGVVGAVMFGVPSLSGTDKRTAQIVSEKTDALTVNPVGNLHFDVANGGVPSEKMRIMANGNVGIGNTNPGEDLSIGDGTANSNWSIGSSSGNRMYLDTYIDAAYLAINRRSSDGAFARSTYGAASIGFVSTTTGGYFDFNTSNTVNTNPTLAVRISQTGYLGIGGITPSYSLDTTGDGRVSGNLGVGGSPDATYSLNASGNSALKLSFSAGYMNFASSSTSTYTTTYGMDDTGFYIVHNSTIRTIRMRSGTSGGVGLAAGATAWGSYSDIRLKNVIAPMTGDLEKLMTLNPIYFKYKNDDPSYPERLGLIAQDVQKVYPEAVSVEPGTGYLMLAYENLIPPIISAIKEQQGEIASLSAQVGPTLTTTGDLNFVDTMATADANFTVPHYFTISDAMGNPIKRMGAYLELAVANLRAGVVNAQQIIVNGQNLGDYIATIVNNIINQKPGQVVSPIASDSIKTNLIAPTATNSAVALRFESDKLSVLNTNNSSGSAVAIIDNQGNASFSGKLTSNQLDTNDASISGTLHVGKIIADQIVSGSSSATYVTNITNVYNSTPSSNTNFGLVNGSSTSTSSGTTNQTQTGTGFMDISSMSGQLSYVPTLSSQTAAFTEGLTVFGPSSLSDVSITGQVAINGSLILANNSINVLGSDFNIQPLRQGGVSIMAGLVYIDTNGNVTFGSDVQVKGTLYANAIAPIPGNDLAINLASPSGKVANLNVTNATGSSILSLNGKSGDLTASGAGTFAKLNLSLIQPAQALSETEITATGSAGTAWIFAHQKEVTIDNSLVTDKSLIYITPTADTKNQVIYLLRQVSGKSFTVGLPDFATSNIPFNWIIVN